MGQADIVNLLQKRPFQPFRLRLSDETVYEIRHPELVLVTPSSVIVGVPAKDAKPRAVGDYVIVSLYHVVKLEPLAERRTK